MSTTSTADSTGKSTTGRDAEKRVSKREFIQRFARRGGVSPNIAQKAYQALIDELLDLVAQGNTVTLTNFGKFYPQTHKGHRVQFAKDDAGGEVKDYTVLKFSATREVNRHIQTDEEVKA
ncbi:MULTISPECIES: HU family DNA-binding protein [unclassified Microbacterium]|uniref:HU family DNA-binding protein n=1 Tax=unclassified Microbacterium TaxID=2609290 RepID=UPI0028832D08|nr:MULTISPECIES: HU family DNA-binding protein [unclassified Microbacterium]